LLKTERLVLRQLLPADGAALVTLRSNETVNQYLDRQANTTPDEAQQFINKITKSVSNNASVYWVIASKETNHLIGTICYWNIVAEEDTAEIGYELHPDFHGKGIMQEAISIVIDFGFTEMNLKTITAFLLHANIPSIKLLERNNFRPDITGKYKDDNDESLKGYVVYVLEKNNV
jgi:ribosomal-protein-alanine N-acetyltransferase